MSTNILEYSYEDERRHLDDDDAVEKYKKERTLHPDALVVLEDLDCGHWDVEVYTSDEEKRQYLQKRVSNILDRFYSAFRRK